MRAGVIAAGEGSRLAGTGLIKPMVPVAGKPLCHWVLESLHGAGLTDVTMLLNSRGTPARESLGERFPKTQFLQKDTPSSWESFKLVANALRKKGEPYIITTTDTILPPKELRAFVDRCEGLPAALALTPFIDDEKPLLASIDDDRVRLGSGAYATAGIYYLSHTIPVEGEFTALRQFLAHLVEEVRTRGIIVGKSLDVDRPEDVKQAEAFITSWSTA